MSSAAPEYTSTVSRVACAGSSALDRLVHIFRKTNSPRGTGHGRGDFHTCTTRSGQGTMPYLSHLYGNSVNSTPIPGTSGPAVTADHQGGCRAPAQHGPTLRPSPRPGR